MISIKSSREIELLRKAGEITGKTHKHLQPFIRPGITTKQLDKLAHDFIVSEGATPSFLHYEGFPASICISINDEVVHGIASSRKLQEGDIVSIDIGACFQGYHGDSAWTYPVGKINKEKEKLLYHTEKALWEGLSVIREGARIGDIGHAVESYACRQNLGVVKELVGHGVGSHVHEEPDVPNYGEKGTGIRLKKGMVLAVEPMLNAGMSSVCILEDGWTIVTEDGSPSAHFEHTVLVTENGYEVLTKR